MKPILSAILVAAGLSLGLSGTAAAKSSDETTSGQGATGTHEASSGHMDGAASRGSVQVTGKIVDAFTEFAGSQENATSLVTGLQTGSEITLRGSGGTGTGGRDAAGKPGSTTFTPPTSSMGNGNVYISLALAKDQLASFGIDSPTPQQIKAALNGGTVSTEGVGTMELPGVLQMRADGMGWGRIAQAQGTKLGWVMSAMKSSSAMPLENVASTSSDMTVVSDTGTGGRAAAGKSTEPSGTTPESGITTATGGRVAASKGSSSANGHGVVDAANGAHGKSGAEHSNAGRGIHNALGGNAASGNAYAYGKAKSHGVSTATGATAGATLAGAGIVNAGGGGHGNSAAAAGMVSGSGGGYGQTAAVATAAAAGVSSQSGAGIVSAAGGHGNGNAYAHGHRRGHGHGYGHWHGRGK